MTSIAVPRRICLVGVRGVGKTTLIRSILDRIPGVDYVLGSAVLRELAGAEFARFDSLPEPVKQEYRERAIEWMIDRQRRTGLHLLCDGHTTLLSQLGEVEQVFTERDCRFFRELILLEAEPEVVLSHRRADQSKRRSLDLAIIAAELTGERAACLRIGAAYQMTVHTLPPSGSPETASRLQEILSR